MKTVKSIATVCLAMTCCCGCLSGAYHLNGESDYPFNATVDAWSNCICVWGHGMPENEIEDAIDAYTKMVYLFWLVDFPFEPISDLILCPFDIIK